MWLCVYMYACIYVSGVCVSMRACEWAGEVGVSASALSQCVCEGEHEGGMSVRGLLGV